MLIAVKYCGKMLANKFFFVIFAHLNQLKISKTIKLCIGL